MKAVYLEIIAFVARMRFFRVQQRCDVAVRIYDDAKEEVDRAAQMVNHEKKLLEAARQDFRRAASAVDRERLTRPLRY